MRSKSNFVGGGALSRVGTILCIIQQCYKINELNLFWEGKGAEHEGKNIFESESFDHFGESNSTRRSSSR